MQSYLVFFTDITTQCSKYCLLNVKQYDNSKKISKFVNFIDPSVYELVDNSEYLNIDKLHYLANGHLLDNEYISIDYPPDMNLSESERFIQKTIDNCIKYSENPQYINTIQSEFQNFVDFVRNFEYLEDQVDFSKKIIGIGNLCRIFKPNSFTDEIFGYLAEKHRQNGYIYHFYGLALRLIVKYCHSFSWCSMDSTKWTRACNNNLKKMFGLNCNRKTRNLYFLNYIHTLYENGFNVIY